MSTTRDNPYVVAVHECWSAVEAAWAPVLAACKLTPLQSNACLANWYGALARAPGRSPLILEVSERSNGELAYLLPLVVVSRGKLTAIEFADDGITDYNMPIPGPAAAASEAQAVLVCAAVLAALPAADLLHLDKMPARLGPWPNPLACLPRTRPSMLAGHRIHMDEDYEQWYRGLARKDRKDAGRSWRLFSAMQNSDFMRARDVGTAQSSAGVCTRLATPIGSTRRRTGISTALSSRMPILPVRPSSPP
jgi:CelD/BcsL family acetyltransferase involved in cellulose biosynthesis